MERAEKRVLREEKGEYMDKNRWKKLIKNILFTILGFILILMGIVFIVNLMVRPTPERKRNISETDAKILVTFSDIEEIRKPIIRTFKLEDWNNFDQKKITKTMEKISGGIEGDIPAVYLKDDNDIIYISFLKDDKEVEVVSIPKIEIEIPEESADTAPYSPENIKVISDVLEKRDGKYSYKLKRYRTQEEKYFLYYNLIKIYYKIDDEQYISTFGLNASNADSGTDFFNNEVLEFPIEAEE